MRVPALTTPLPRSGLLRRLVPDPILHPPAPLLSPFPSLRSPPPPLPPSPPPPALHSFIGLRPLLTHFLSPLLPYFAHSTLNAHPPYPPTQPRSHTRYARADDAEELQFWWAAISVEKPVRLPPSSALPTPGLLLPYPDTSPSHDALSCTPWKCLPPLSFAHPLRSSLTAPLRSTCSLGCSNPPHSAQLAPLHSLRSTLAAPLSPLHSLHPLATPTRPAHSLHSTRSTLLAPPGSRSMISPTSASSPCAA